MSDLAPPSPLAEPSPCWPSVAASSRRLQQQLTLLSNTSAHVLLLGEPSTGKPAIAQQIHQSSDRRSMPFHAVNCGAFPDDHADSELFGVEKGALPGAFVSRAGWLTASHRGTLFMDEVDRLSPALQGKLLTVLREGRLLRLGARAPEQVDIRVIAASSVDLEAAVRAGRFRDDLFFALRVVPLQVPPLRERREDILPLAQYFISRYRQRMGYPARSLAPAAQQRLLAHHWPGNLRELENVIQHALVFCPDPEIQAEHLSLSGLSPMVPAPPAPPDDSADAALRAAIERLLVDRPGQVFKLVEQLTMRTAYQHSQGNQVKAARLLGLSRNVLRARLIEFGDIDALR